MIENQQVTNILRLEMDSFDLCLFNAPKDNFLHDI